MFWANRFFAAFGVSVLLIAACGSKEDQEDRCAIPASAVTNKTVLESGQAGKEVDWKFKSYFAKNEKVRTIGHIVTNRHDKAILGVECKDLDFAYQEIDPGACAKTFWQTTRGYAEQQHELAIGVTTKPSKHRVSAYGSGDTDPLGVGNKGFDLENGLRSVFANNGLECQFDAYITTKTELGNEGRVEVKLKSNLLLDRILYPRKKYKQWKDPPATLSLAILVDKTLMEPGGKLLTPEPKQLPIAHPTYSHYRLLDYKLTQADRDGKNDIELLPSEVAFSFPDHAHTPATKIRESKASIGIVVCSGGVGGLIQKLEAGKGAVDASGRVTFFVVAFE
jgi:hypothetical protein